jgi:hypothetical protein
MEKCAKIALQLAIHLKTVLTFISCMRMSSNYYYIAGAGMAKIEGWTFHNLTAAHKSPSIRGAGGDDQNSFDQIQSWWLVFGP